MVLSSTPLTLASSIIKDPFKPEIIHANTNSDDVHRSMIVLSKPAANSIPANDPADKHIGEVGIDGGVAFLFRRDEEA
jgi:hypothetical protein